MTAVRNWAKYDRAFDLKERGLTFEQIGAALDVSGTRARQMIYTREREDKRLALEAADPSLVPWWRGLKYSTYHQLVTRKIDSREKCLRFAATELPMRGDHVLHPDIDEWPGYLTLAVVNDIRVWLGVAPYAKPPRVVPLAELHRARNLLERHGWKVQPPATTTAEGRDSSPEGAKRHT